MGKINVLSFEVANLIAAGEVVDRPASVIKELVENSIDSGADRITVEIQRGGVLFMRVADNGCGMEPDDLPVAVKRHATSKIHNAGDLNGIMTLGFRGEALAAICAVSDVRIITKTADAALGSYIEVNSGRVGDVSERGASKGTTVIVENLFANVPARLKFLKRDQTEAMAVCGVVEKIAMSHPEIAFRLISDGNVKLETSGSGDLFSAIRSVYGREFAGKMLKLEAEQEGIKAYGYITAPDVPRSNRNYQNFFINGRYIKTKTGSAAIEQAYTSYIPPEKFPGCVICLEISPNVVDVNVHPSKLEVKFSNERPVFDCIYQSVRSTLLQNTVRPGDELREQPDTAPASKLPAGYRISKSFAPVRDRVADAGSQNRQMNISDSYASVNFNRPPKRELPRSVLTENMPLTSAGSLHDLRAGIPMGFAQGDNEEPEEYAELPPPTATVYDPHKEDAIDAENDAKLKAEEDAEPDGAYRIVGELFNSYIIVEKKSEILLIDKHAAHERLIFEKLKKMSSGAKRSTQFLVVPIEIMLMSDEVDAIEQYRSRIESAGFSFSCARNTVSVNEMPMDISASVVASIFEGFADVIKNSTGSVELTEDIIFEKALYQASCKAAIKAGRVYPADYNEWLVRQLFENPEVTYCPHGRPIAFTVKRTDIDHRFKRL